MKVSRELRYTFSELLRVLEKLVLVMKGMIDSNFLTVLAAIPILGAAFFFGCDGVLEPVTM